MCGLFLSVDLPAGPAAISAVSHRGPDALAWEQFKLGSHDVSVGHARLKIWDLSDDANQPFYDDSRDNLLLFNGAIYNYIELRQDLEAIGFKFRTQSDTEVLLCALKYWGIEALPRLSGMFALIWINLTENRIFAARDRFGIKPLYFTQTEKGLAFASEIKQLLTLNVRPPTLNPEAAFDFLDAGLTDHLAETFFQGIFQLKGGQFADIHLSDGLEVQPIKAQSWWKPAALSGYKVKPLADEAKAFKAKFDRSLKLHMRADVRVGACLSGGMDSSAIVTGIDCMAADNAMTLETFTAEFIGESVDESVYARAVNDGCHHTHYNYVRPRAEDLRSTLPEILYHQDEPFGSSSLYAQWSVFEAAREAGMTVMLDGQGADEILAGYHPGYIYHFIDLIRKGRWLKLRKTLKAYGKVHDTDTRLVLREAVVKTVQASAILNPVLNLWRGFRRYKRPKVAHWLSGPGFAPIFARGREDILGACARREGLKKPLNLDGLCRLMVTSISLPSLLRFEDRNAMAHSLESRVPFLDPDLAQFCLDLGDQYKICGLETKQVLRAAVGHRLPQSVTSRMDKIGFATPEDRWFTGPLKDDIIKGALDCVTAYPSLFNGPLTRSWIKQVGEAEIPYTRRLWRIYIFGLWMEKFDVSLPDLTAEVL